MATANEMAATNEDRLAREIRLGPRVRSRTGEFEALTYGPHSQESWVADCWRARRLSDDGAQRRLERHAVEMRSVLPGLERRSSSAGLPDGLTVTYEARAIDLSAGNGGFSVPPLWLIEDEGVAPRPMRTLAALVPSYPLRPGVASVQVPRIVTGTTTAPQTPSSVVSDTDLADAQTGSQVVTIAGHSDVALQLIELSGRNGAAFDQIVYRDLLSSYDAQLDAQLVAGSGTGVGSFQQLPGLTAIAGIGSISYTDLSPTASEMFASFGKAYASVSNARGAHPEAWLARGGRFAWLATSEDTAGRPFELPASALAYVSDPSLPTPIGGLIGQPLFGVESIPVNLGAGGNQDAMFAVRPSDMLLFEGRPQVATFDEVMAGTLTGRVQLRRYVAAIVGRYPSAICQVGGTGFVVPAGF